MTGITELYNMLEQMVEKAELKESEEVFRLNESYREKETEVFDCSIEKLRMLYDNCRQSCMMSVQYPNLYTKALNDAKQILEEIKELNKKN